MLRHLRILLVCIFVIVNSSAALRTKTEVELEPDFVDVSSTRNEPSPISDNDIDILKRGLALAPKTKPSFLDRAFEDETPVNMVQSEGESELEVDPTSTVSQTPALSTATAVSPSNDHSKTESAVLDSVKQKLTTNVVNIDGHIERLVQDVDKLVSAKRDFTDAVMAGKLSKITPNELALYMLKKNKRAEFRPRPLSAPSSKDIIDCTACRFAWLKVETDLANTYSEKLIYDAFVTHCSTMQKTDIFYSACNDMFAQIDDMIGDYLNGFTVSQMCMNARMCR